VRLREGGATLLSTGSHGSWVGFRHPEIRRIELCSWVSMSLLSMMEWNKLVTLNVDNKI